MTLMFPSPKEYLDKFMSPKEVVEPVLAPTREVRWPSQTPWIHVDVKQWFIGAITPDFDTIEAKVRCGSFRDGHTHGFLPSPRLEAATRDMRTANTLLNSPPPQGVPQHAPDGEVETELQLPPPRRSLLERWFSRLEPGSVRSTSLALMATALGAGALAVPYAFSLTGVGLGLVTLLFAALVSALSLQILMVAARYTGRTSYAQLLELAVGCSAASIALDLTVVLNGMGAAICILIFEGDFIPAILRAPPGGLAGYELSRRAAVVLSAVAAWPLTLPDDISALRFVALAVPVALMLTAALVMCDMPEFHRQTRDEGWRVKWWSFSPLRWLQASSIMINAFANHQNAVPCANQLIKPSVARVVKVTVNANLAVWALLATLGVGGYMSWAGATQGDFLLNYPTGRPEIWVCRLMLALIVYFVLPLGILPTAKSAAQLVLRLAGHKNLNISGRTHAVAATTCLAGCTVVAAHTNDVAAVVGILGGLLASSLMFWFPAIVFYQLLWPVQPRIFRGPVLLAMAFLGAVGWSSVIGSIIF